MFRESFPERGLLTWSQNEGRGAGTAGAEERRREEQGSPKAGAECGVAGKGNSRKAKASEPGKRKISKSFLLCFQNRILSRTASHLLP